MLPERRRQILLAVLAIVLAAVVYVEWPHPSAEVRTTANQRGGTRAAAVPSGVTAPDVHLKSLEADRTKPGEVERNLFRFRTKPAPPPPPRQDAVFAAPQPVVPSGPPPPPPLPPIALKFIGLLERSSQKIAVLSDGRGVPLYGREGDTVLGQYKILHIGVESIEMAYLDGRGRQTIRLSGS
jgi:hypothetical protein